MVEEQKRTNFEYWVKPRETQQNRQNIRFHSSAEPAQFKVVLWQTERNL